MKPAVDQKRNVIEHESLILKVFIVWGHAGLRCGKHNCLRVLIQSNLYLNQQMIIMVCIVWEINISDKYFMTFMFDLAESPTKQTRTTILPTID